MQPVKQTTHRSSAAPPIPIVHLDPSLGIYQASGMREIKCPDGSTLLMGRTGQSQTGRLTT
jgi:hypothetical protein